MIQWLQSKIVMIIVGIILISSIISVFHHQMGQMEKEERDNISRKISLIIDNMYATEVDEMRQRITFDEDSNGIFLSPTIRDERYSIEIWTDLIRVKSQGGTSYRRLQRSIRLWSPDEMNHTGSLEEEEIGWRDQDERYLKVESGESDIELIMLTLEGGGEKRPHVFISKRGEG